MPELPEVETTRRGILPSLRGRRIRGVEVRESRLRWPVPPDLDAILRGANPAELPVEQPAKFDLAISVRTAARPAPAVLVIDEGGAVDTEEFNRADRAKILSSQARAHEEAFSALAAGSRRGDPAAVGEAATESAKACGLSLARPWHDRSLSLCLSLLHT